MNIYLGPHKESLIWNPINKSNYFEENKLEKICPTIKKRIEKFYELDEKKNIYNINDFDYYINNSNIELNDLIMKNNNYEINQNINIEYVDNYIEDSFIYYYDFDKSIEDYYNQDNNINFNNLNYIDKDCFEDYLNDFDEEYDFEEEPEQQVELDIEYDSSLEF